MFDRSGQQGRLEMTGRDRFDLLHRMSTNDLLAIQPGEGRSTVLTTALARIIDRLIVYHRGDTALVLMNYPNVVRPWLQKHIFFRDQVKLRDVSAELGQLEVYGAEAASSVANLVGSIAEEDLSRLALHQFVEAPIDGGTCLIARTFPLDGDGFVLIAPSVSLDKLKAACPVVHFGDSDYERLRIRAGLPGPGHELTEDYLPLEANLWDSVSFTKGCYIGQEIIARMESRHRLAKTLVCLSLPAVVPTGSELYDGTDRVGLITSVAPSAEGAAIALGFVKPDRAEPGSQLIVRTEPDTGEPSTAEIILARLLSYHR